MNTTQERLETFKFIYSEERVIKVEEHDEYILIQVEDGSWYKQTDTETSWLGSR